MGFDSIAAANCCAICQSCCYRREFGHFVQKSIVKQHTQKKREKISRRFTDVLARKVSRVKSQTFVFLFFFVDHVKMIEDLSIVCWYLFLFDRTMLSRDGPNLVRESDYIMAESLINYKSKKSHWIISLGFFQGSFFIGCVWLGPVSLM